MSCKILLAELSILVKLKVFGIGKYTMPISEHGKGREEINSYEQIMASTTCSNPSTVVFLINSVSHNLSHKQDHYKSSVALGLLTAEVREELVNFSEK